MKSYKIKADSVRALALHAVRYLHEAFRYNFRGKLLKRVGIEHQSPFRAKDDKYKSRPGRDY